MYTEEKSGVKRIHRLLMAWKSKFCTVWESPLLYHRNPYYLNIYFNTCFYITDIHTNQKYLKHFYDSKKFPKTLYRIVNPEKQKSLLYLFYQLKYVAPRSYHKVYLQLNSSKIIANGRVKVLNSRKSYCLKLRLINYQDKLPILNQYQDIPTHIRDVGYKLYEDIHKEPLTQPIKVGSIFNKHPYSRTILYRSFYKVIGATPSKVWRNRRLLHYAYHLLDTNDSITDSYAQFGFNSTSHLHRNFKKKFHISPLEFRKKYRKP